MKSVFCVLFDTQNNVIKFFVYEEVVQHIFIYFILLIYP